LIVSITCAKSYKSIQYISLLEVESRFILSFEPLWVDSCLCHWAKPCGLIPGVYLMIVNCLYFWVGLCNE